MAVWATKAEDSTTARLLAGTGVLLDQEDLAVGLVDQVGMVLLASLSVYRAS